MEDLKRLAALLKWIAEYSYDCNVEISQAQSAQLGSLNETCRNVVLFAAGSNLHTSIKDRITRSVFQIEFGLIRDLLSIMAGLDVYDFHEFWDREAKALAQLVTIVEKAAA